MKKLALVVILFIFSGLAFFWYTSTKQQAFRVSEVIDGDTIILDDGRTVRYISVDAPELKKGPKGQDKCFAQEATEINRQLVENKRVRIETDKNEMDRFGRTLAYVYLDETFINQHLLEQGAAKFHLDTVNLKHQADLIAVTQKAHEDKVGLWSQCAPDPKVGCQVKGNYDKWGQRRYHLPNFRHYQQVVINYEDGDQWFCTEKEAIKAGFEKARE